MAKAKVTRRPHGQTVTLRPSRLRMFVVYMVMFALALAVGMLFRVIANGWAATWAWASQNWPAWLAIILGGAALMAVIEHGRWTLRLLEGDKLEGPTGMFGERVVIPSSDIDRERTRRSMSSRLRMGNAIYGPGRARILVSPWFFEPAALRELLGQVGVDAS